MLIIILRYKIPRNNFNKNNNKKTLLNIHVYKRRINAIVVFMQVSERVAKKNMRNFKFYLFKKSPRKKYANERNSQSKNAWNPSDFLENIFISCLFVQEFILPVCLSKNLFFLFVCPRIYSSCLFVQEFILPVCLSKNLYFLFADAGN